MEDGHSWPSIIHSRVGTNFNPQVSSVGVGSDLGGSNFGAVDSTFSSGGSGRDALLDSGLEWTE